MRALWLLPILALTATQAAAESLTLSGNATGRIAVNFGAELDPSFEVGFRFELPDDELMATFPMMGPGPIRYGPMNGRVFLEYEGETVYDTNAELWLHAFLTVGGGSPELDFILFYENAGTFAMERNLPNVPASGEIFGFEYSGRIDQLDPDLIVPPGRNVQDFLHRQAAAASRLRFAGEYNPSFVFDGPVTSWQVSGVPEPAPLSLLALAAVCWPAWSLSTTLRGRVRRASSGCSRSSRLRTR